jgi:hypothetical protein
MKGRADERGCDQRASQPVGLMMTFVQASQFIAMLVLALLASAMVSRRIARRADTRSRGADMGAPSSGTPPHDLHSSEKLARSPASSPCEAEHRERIASPDVRPLPRVSQPDRDTSGNGRPS